MTVAFTVNGAVQSVDAPESATLLEVLRNHLGLRGTRVPILRDALRAPQDEDGRWLESSPFKGRGVGVMRRRRGHDPS
ncbi:MAG: hypothetical protein JSR47_19100, partial [Proteobacteria bacterium]|nr:hypothetical protein [Pseudomonadota bacterium]